MQNHSEAVPGVLVYEWDDLDGKPGAFMWDAKRETLLCMCPCGCGSVWAYHIPRWTWDGNRERPTCTPSMRLLSHCRWHGFLTAGVFKPCGDSGR